MPASSGLSGLETMAAALPFADGVFPISMVNFELYSKAAEFLSKGKPFVSASVVRFQAPISGKPDHPQPVVARGSHFLWAVCQYSKGLLRIRAD